MKKSILREYGVNSNSDLRELLKAGKAQKINEIITESRNNIYNRSTIEAIERFSDVAKIATTYFNDPDNEKIPSLIFTNSGGYVTHIMPIYKDSNRFIFESLINKSATTFFYIAPDLNNNNSIEDNMQLQKELKENHEPLIELLEKCGLKHTDTLYQFDGNVWYSVHADSFFTCEEEIVYYDEYFQNMKDEITQYVDLIDFLQEDAIESCKGLNVYHDKDIILRNLRSGFMWKGREVCTYISYDENYNITNIDTIEGDLNSCIAPISYMIELALKDNVKGLWFIHNHPSGLTDLSIDDKVISEKMSEILSEIKRELYMSSIISLNGINNYYINDNAYPKDYNLEKIRNTEKNNINNKSNKETQKEPIIPKNKPKHNSMSEVIPQIHNVLNSGPDDKSM